MAERKKRKAKPKGKAKAPKPKAKAKAKQAPLTVKQLRVQAKELRLKGYSKLPKDKLAAAIAEALAAAPVTPLGGEGAETGETPYKKERDPPSGGQWAEPWMGKFIGHLANGGTVAAACELCVIGRATVYRHRQKDEDFAVAWADAEEESTEKLEEEAFRRAFKGVEKPVHYEGRRIDFVTEYSDTMLIFLLKARKPLTYRDRIDLNHSGAVRNPKAPGAGDTLDLSKLDQKEIDTLERLHSKAAVTEEAPA